MNVFGTFIDYVKETSTDILNTNISEYTIDYLKQFIVSETEDSQKRVYIFFKHPSEIIKTCETKGLSLDTKIDKVTLRYDENFEQLLNLNFLDKIEQYLLENKKNKGQLILYYQ
jgi:hypothetical protein